MSFSIEFAEDTQEYRARIKVVGVGGSGGNAVNTMINFGLEGVDFIVINTDAQALNSNAAQTKLNIGSNITRGLGAGADPERGRKAALEDHQRIKELITGADMVFVTAGMGGGTGTGAAPVIAQLAREEGALTVGVVTKPFLFEGRQRARRADLGLAMLTEHVDTLITIPNQKLLMLGDDDLTFIEACRKADEVLYQAVKGISDLITQNGVINVDFADVKTVMSNMGRALMGTGVAKGQNRARMAAEMAVMSPLLDDISVEGAMGVLINIVGGPDLKMKEAAEAASLVQEQAHEDANVIFGASIDESLGENVKVTVIATGFEIAEAIQQEPVRHENVRHDHMRHDNARHDVRHDSARPQMMSPPPPQRSNFIGVRGGPVAEVTPISSRRAQSAQEVRREAPPVRVPLSSSRERVAPDPFPSFETDWDVPAFQRKQR